MRKTLLLGFALASFGLNAQSIADQQVVQSTNTPSHPVAYNTNEAKSYTLSGATTLPCDSGSTTLSVTGACSYEWYSDAAATNLIVSNTDLVTPMLYNDTTFYLSTTDPGSSTLAAMPAQSSTFSSNVRGYFFTAPSNFTFTGFYVPTDASTGNMNVGVVRLNTAPPLFSATTNDFSLLGYWPSSTDDTIYACIPVQAGDIIGILGSRGSDVVSYATGPNTIMIDGVSTTIERMGMQFALASTAPQDLFTETGGNIGRVEFLYSTAASSTIDPITITVPSVDVTGSVNGVTITANEASATYQWIDCGNANVIIPGETGQSFTATSNGSYAVVIDDGTCVDTSECWLINNIGLDEITGENLEVFPNPATDNITIKSTIDLGNTTLKITDMTGRVIETYTNLNGFEKTIAIDHLSTGQYNLLIIDGQSVTNKQFVKK